MPRWSVERFRDISGKFCYPILRREAERGGGGWMSERGICAYSRISRKLARPRAFLVVVHPARTNASPTVWLRKKSFGPKSLCKTRPITRPAASHAERAAPGVYMVLYRADHSDIPALSQTLCPLSCSSLSLKNPEVPRASHRGRENETHAVYLPFRFIIAHISEIFLCRDIARRQVTRGL